MSRYPYSSRRMVESCIKITVKQIKRFLDKPYESRIHNAQIYIVYLDSEKTLIMRHEGHNEDKLELTIRILEQDCNYGNKRYYFACPGCDEKSYTLYAPRNAREFKCRKCYNLTYEKQKEHNKRMDVYKSFEYACQIERLYETGVHRTITGRRKIEKLEQKRILSILRNKERIKELL